MKYKRVRIPSLNASIYKVPHKGRVYVVYSSRFNAYIESGNKLSNRKIREICWKILIINNFVKQDRQIAHLLYLFLRDHGYTISVDGAEFSCGHTSMRPLNKNTWLVHNRYERKEVKVNDPYFFNIVLKMCKDSNKIL